MSPAELASAMAAAQVAYTSGGCGGGAYRGGSRLADDVNIMHAVSDSSGGEEETGGEDGYAAAQSFWG